MKANSANDFSLGSFWQQITGMFRNQLQEMYPSLLPDKKRLEDQETRIENLQKTYFVTWKENEDKQKKLEEYEKEIARIKKLAVTDQLTGALTQEGMLSRYHGQISSRIHQADFPLVATLFLDVDWLKEVNDTLGHRAGDEVLVALADIVAKNVRSEDIVCRLGGDKFLVIFPRTDNDQVYASAEKLQRLLQKDNRMRPDGLPVTVSMRIASLDFTSNDKDLALEDALRWAGSIKTKERKSIIVLDAGTKGD